MYVDNKGVMNPVSDGFNTNIYRQVKVQLLLNRLYAARLTNYIHTSVYGVAVPTSIPKRLQPVNSFTLYFIILQC